MKNIFIVGFVIAISVFSCQTQEKKPNIIIINIDDMGWRDLGFMGSEFYVTPNIDKLSAQGMVFTNGYAASANCAPSRACLMTGQWTPRHGIYTVGSSERGNSKDRKLIPTKNTTTLDPQIPIFPKVLQENGYATCTAGKWHLSDDPLTYGFDVNIGGGHSGHPKSYYPPYRNVDLQPENGEHLTDLVMSKAIDFVKSASKPFLLYYTPYAVHTPIQPIDSLKVKYENKPPWKGQSNIAYATMIENLDRNIGRLLKVLEDMDAIENTFIVLTSDNGGFYGITYQRPLRDGKGSYYEGGIRVPFMFYWEGRIQAGTQSDVPITNLDIFPSILELTGIDTNKYQMDGESLIPVLTNEGQLKERPLYWHFPIYLQAYDKKNNQTRDSLFRTRPGSVIRLGDWKLHQYFEDNGIELYNLKEDISETTNLAEKQPEKVEELMKVLNQWRVTTEAPVPTTLNPEFESE